MYIILPYIVMYIIYKIIIDFHFFNYSHEGVPNLPVEWGPGVPNIPVDWGRGSPISIGRMGTRGPHSHEGVPNLPVEWGPGVPNIPVDWGRGSLIYR